MSVFQLVGNVLQLQEVGDYEVPHVRDLTPQNPARAGHKASFNPDPSGNRQFLISVVVLNLRQFQVPSKIFILEFTKILWFEILTFSIR